MLFSHLDFFFPFSSDNFTLEMNNISILNNIILSFFSERLLQLFNSIRSKCFKILISHDFCTNKSFLEICVDHTCSLEKIFFSHPSIEIINQNMKSIIISYLWSSRVLLDSPSPDFIGSNCEEVIHVQQGISIDNNRMKLRCI